MRTARSITRFVLIALIAAAATAQEKRSRGEGFHRCQSSNPVGDGNLWVTFGGVGHVWDDVGTDRESAETSRGPFAQMNLRGFPELRGEAGLLNVSSVYLEMRPLSWAWTFGWIAGGAKLTLPNNRDLRLHGAGIDMRYIHSFHNGPPTIGGYKGFLPEGFMPLGGSLQLSALYDLDVIARVSWLPLKLTANAGLRIHLQEAFREYSQYLLSAAIAYVGLGMDFFVEYSLAAFLNGGTEPKLFEQDGMRFEVAFAENPMYVTPGMRVRYPRGLVLFACVPILLSTNRGSAHTPQDLTSMDRGGFAQERARGVTVPFDPWYVKWKIVVGASLPLRFELTGAEMRRNFLLKKNRRDKTRIDLNERLKGEDSGEEEDEEAERERRLERIRRKREQIGEQP